MVAKRKAGNVKNMIRKSTLRSALVAGLKASTGRKDIQFTAAPKVAAETQKIVPIEERAGYPLKFPKGAVDPKDWQTVHGVKIEVDFCRAPWLPDDWGQGVKTCQRNARSTAGGGGILTAYVGPDMKVFFHKKTTEEYCGRTFSRADGWNGQVRQARMQAQQAIQLARAQIKEKQKGGSVDLITTDPDSSFFKLLSARERKALPRKDELHFAIVSARRATTVEGVRDIWMVQSQFVEAGVTPTWYVDDASLKDYQGLGLKAVVGGKLTQARNKALRDARKLGKACVQCSDDISAWEYREGKPAKSRNDDELNAAHAAARRYIVSPVAAARFILAKMRGAEEPKPKLGGVYMLGSCARAFVGEPFARHHFIHGDFFVDDGSKVLFDEQMRLKEDYDFTCSHIKAYGSVMRCQRMTLNVKHYDNGGGACSNRDKKGEEERRNIAILHEKWPGCFSANPKRRNEVILRWKSTCGDNDDDNGDEKVRERKKGLVARKLPVKTQRKTSGSLSKVKKSSVKCPKESSVLSRTDKPISVDYIAERCRKINGRTVAAALSVTYRDGKGTSRSYSVSDLKYDMERGYVGVKRS